MTVNPQFCTILFAGAAFFNGVRSAVEKPGVKK